jgi:uridine kinase
LESLPKVPWVAIVSQDSFYKSLSKEQSKLAFENNYDFDHPNALDHDLLKRCIAE